MSEQSICRRERRTLAAARAPRADDPDRFRIATSPECVRDHEHVARKTGQGTLAGSHVVANDIGGIVATHDVSGFRDGSSKNCITIAA